MRARASGDHGEAQDAIDFILDGSAEIGPGEAELFLRGWRKGDLDEWPEFYAWLDKREADDRAWRRAEKKRLKTFRIGSLRPSDGAQEASTKANSGTDSLPDDLNVEVK